MAKKSRAAAAAGRVWPNETSRDAARLRDDLAWLEASRAGEIPHRPPDAALATAREIRDELEATAANQATWNRIPKAQFQMLAWQQILALSADPDRTTANRRTGWFPALHAAMEKRLTVQERLRLAEHLAQQCDRLGMDAANVLTPMLFIETNDSVFSTTVITMASHVQPSGDEPGVVAGTAIALRMRQVLPPRRQGLLFGALLQMGDRRTHPLLAEAGETLPDAATQTVFKAPSGIMQGGVAEFLLGRMEATDEAGFGPLAAGLVSMRRAAMVEQVWDVERDLPPATPETNPVRTLRAWTVPEFAAHIEPRLRALAERETSERLVPFILEAWGLSWEPASDEERFEHERMGRQLGLSPVGRSGGRRVQA